MTRYSPPCVKCGRKHHTIVKDGDTGKVKHKFDKCFTCLVEEGKWLGSSEAICNEEKVYQTSC